MRTLLRNLILVVLVLLIFHQSSQEISFYEMVLSFVALIVVIISVLSLLVSKKPLPKPLIYLLAFTIWVVLDIFIAWASGVDLLWSLRRFFPIFTFAGLALAAFTSFRSNKEILIAYWEMVFISIIIILRSMSGLNYINLGLIDNAQLLRQYSGEYFASFSFCLVLPFFFYKMKSKFLKVAIFIAVFLSGFGLVFSLTRTYWISTTLSVLFMIYLIKRKQRNFAFGVFFRLATFGVLIIVIIILIANEINVPIVTYALSRINSINTDLSFLDRLMELKGIWESILKNPITILIGNGLGAKFTFYSVNPFSWGTLGWMQNDYSHNYYAYLLWSTGLIGLVLFLMAFGSFLRQSIQCLVCSKEMSWSDVYLIGVSAVVVNLLIASLAGPPLFDIKWSIYFGVLVGLGLALMKVSHISNLEELNKEKEQLYE